MNEEKEKRRLRIVSAAIAACEKTLLSEIATEQDAADVLAWVTAEIAAHYADKVRLIARSNMLKRDFEDKWKSPTG